MLNRISLVMAMIIMLLFFNSCSDDSVSSIDYTIDQSEIGTGIGQTGPDFTLDDNNDNPVSLSQFRGKVVILLFWRTNCGSCKYIMKDLKELWDKYKDDNFVIIGLSLDMSSSTWKAFLNQNDYNWIQLIDDRAGWSNSQLFPYCDTFEYIPYSFVLNKYGQIVAADSPFDLEFETLIDTALQD